jgi:hypothetical protein
VDVLLAIHLVRLAAAKAFDLAVIVSADNDLVPALELVCDVRGAEAVESVSLQAAPGYVSAPALGVSVTEKRPQIRRRLIPRSDYETIEDTRKYNVAAPAFVPLTSGELPGQNGRRLPPRR